jgi:uracil-DNA glycosylase
MSNADDATFVLDERQRRMLEAMGVRVWAAPDPTHISVSASPDAPPVQQEQQASAPIKSATTVKAPVRSPASACASGSRAAIADMDWLTLQATVSQCKACGLCEQRKNSVFGAGSPSAQAHLPPRVDWLIVGEAPGEQEDLAAEPFVGQAGKLLDNMLRALDLSRQSTQGGGVYIINTLKCRPPANRNPSAEELLQCAPFLDRQIALLQPRVIVAMGRFAAQSLLHAQLPDIDKIPLGKLRGQVLTYQNTPVIVTYHPAYLLRSLSEKAKAWDDLVLAWKTLQQVPARAD